MKTRPNPSNAQPTLLVDSEVVRQIRQHARSSSKTEICGVLIGQDRDQRITIAACIEGENAQEAGAHVTFTQDTWEHIYAVKDKKFPEERIVGWYHSHPGFGVFLSEHDTFIHKNFFSSPGQVAWVFDPQSDEEGCFGWVNGRIVRLTQIAIVDRRGGQEAEENAALPEHALTQVADVAVQARPGATLQTSPHRIQRPNVDEVMASKQSSLERMVYMVFSSLLTMALGFALAWYVFPRVVVMPVLVDPRTGQLVDPQTGEVLSAPPDASSIGRPGDSKPDGKKQGQPAAPGPAKEEGNVQPK